MIIINSNRHLIVYPPPWSLRVAIKPRLWIILKPAIPEADFWLISPKLHAHELGTCVNVLNLRISHGKICTIRISARLAIRNAVIKTELMTINVKVSLRKVYCMIKRELCLMCAFNPRILIGSSSVVWTHRT